MYVRDVSRLAVQGDAGGPADGGSEEAAGGHRVGHHHRVGGRHGQRPSYHNVNEYLLHMI